MFPVFQVRTLYSIFKRSVQDVVIINRQNISGLCMYERYNSFLAPSGSYEIG